MVFERMGTGYGHGIEQKRGLHCPIFRDLKIKNKINKIIRLEIIFTCKNIQKRFLLKMIAYKQYEYNS